MLLHPTTSFIFFVYASGCGSGVLALRYSRPVIIVGTGLFGGILAGVSLAKLLGLSQFPYGIGMSLGLAVLGMAIQFLINPSDYDEDDDEEDGDDEEEEALDDDEDLDYEDYLDDDYYIDEDKE